MLLLGGHLIVWMTETSHTNHLKPCSDLQPEAVSGADFTLSIECTVCVGGLPLVLEARVCVYWSVCWYSETKRVQYYTCSDGAKEQVKPRTHSLKQGCTH